MSSSQIRQGAQSAAPQQQQGSAGNSQQQQQGSAPVPRFTDWASI